MNRRLTVLSPTDTQDSLFQPGIRVRMLSIALELFLAVPPFHNLWYPRDEISLGGICVCGVAGIRRDSGKDRLDSCRGALYSHYPGLVLSPGC
jgi:hypothetical protein